jgi:hypothetical protein
MPSGRFASAFNFIIQQSGADFPLVWHIDRSRAELGPRAVVMGNE